MQKASGTATRTFKKMRDDTRSATRQMEQDVVRSTSRIERALATSSTRIGALGGVVGARALGLLGAGLGARQILIFADAWTRVGNSLKVAGVPAEQMQVTLDRLFRIAQNSGTAIEPTVQLFRLSQSAGA